jgi:hypothetical protein
MQCDADHSVNRRFVLMVPRFLTELGPDDEHGEGLGAAEPESNPTK